MLLHFPALLRVNFRHGRMWAEEKRAAPRPGGAATIEAIQSD